jgi:hypothetical protein
MEERAVRRAFWFEKPTGRLLVMDEVRRAGRRVFACDLQLAPAAIEIEGRVARLESPGREWCPAVCGVAREWCEPGGLHRMEFRRGVTLGCHAATPGRHSLEWVLAMERSSRYS